MRTPTLILVASLAGCGHKSKLETDRAGQVDALWELAPDGTEVGVVASPRAIGLLVRAIGALHELAAVPDFAPARPQLEWLLTALLGSPDARPADAGIALDRGFAMFVTADGVLGVMPVADRDKFMATKHGHRGSESDTLDGNTCKPVRDLYVCATSQKMFERLGKGHLRGKTALMLPRGDIEVFAPDVSLSGGKPGDLALAAHLDEGQFTVDGRWTGTPGGTLGQFAGITAPHPDTNGVSGFVTVSVAPLLARLPAIPLAGGVTLDQLAKTIKGPITIGIPSGSLDLQIHVPVSDPVPATTLIEHCKELGMLQLAQTQTPGACRFQLQAASVLELDAWVEGNELRIGAHKGAPAPGKAGGLTPFANELAGGDWTAAFWGRGTMLNLTGTAPVTAELPPEATLGVHAVALINELGAAIKVDKDGARLRVMVRTAWANPPEVVAKVIAIKGDDIVRGKAIEPAKAIAAGAPEAPFAADFAAGQGGLMVPAAALGLVSAIVIPAFMRYVQGGSADASPQPRGTTPVDDKQLASLLVQAYAFEAYPQWAAAHPDKTCPSSLTELAGYVPVDPKVPTLTDPWGHPLIIKCGTELPAGAKGIGVMSLGPDGKEGTADDIHSW